MYLISIYFDEQTDNRIRSFMKQIAKHTGNLAMIAGNVPPHITVGAFRTASEEKAKSVFDRITRRVGVGEIHWVSVGAFFPRVLYLTPVLNEYLHQLSVITRSEMEKQEVVISSQYQPFSWLPHATLGKTLNIEEMRTAFEVMQSQFAPFKSSVIKIGLAKTDPYTDLESYVLK